MKCEKFITLRELYLDSELSPKTTLLVRQHLESCPDCARSFAEQENFESRMATRLKEGQRTAELWQRIETDLAERARSASRLPRRPTQVAAVQRLVGLLRTGMRIVHVKFAPSIAQWTALAAVWLIVLGLNVASREPDAPEQAVAAQAPSVSELRIAFQQRELLAAELGVVPSAAEQDKPSRQGPRTDGRSPTRNS
jgi:anti-sigma factor RsiW